MSRPGGGRGGEEELRALIATELAAALARPVLFVEGEALATERLRAQKAALPGGAGIAVSGRAWNSREQLGASHAAGRPPCGPRPCEQHDDAAAAGAPHGTLLCAGSPGHRRLTTFAALAAFFCALLLSGAAPAVLSAMVGGVTAAPTKVCREHAAVPQSYLVCIVYNNTSLPHVIETCPHLT